MDSEHFDSLTRSLSTLGSRRGALAAVLGGSLGLLGRDSIEARNKKKKACPPCKKRKKGKCKRNLPDGTACKGGTCLSGSCHARAATCTDGLKNGDETDVDCGGSCPRCGTSKSCAKPTDCASSFCGTSTCQVCQGLTQECGADSVGACSCFPQVNEDREFVQFTCIRGNNFTPGTTGCSGDRVFVATSGDSFACAKPCGAPP